MNKRTRNILDSLIKKHGLSLDGLSILTEAASGPYKYSPILAALAGSKKVTALTSDSVHGTVEDVIKETKKIAEYYKVEDRINITNNKNKIDYSEFDIITNSGFVRPIGKKIVSKMKKTAVIPLMWETWEYRGDEVELEACKENEILVLGTDESHPSLDIDPFIEMLLLRLLFDLGLSGYRSKILLVSSNKFGQRLRDVCKKYKIECTWFSFEDQDALPMSTFSTYVENKLDQYDALIIAEMKDVNCILGREGLLKGRDLLTANPSIKVGIIAGNVDTEDLKISNITYFPEQIAPPRYVTYQVYQLGIIPVLELYCSGLKVGQVMSDARRKGKDIKESVKYAIENSAAMDFQGKLAYL